MKHVSGIGLPEPMLSTAKSPVSTVSIADQGGRFAKNISATHSSFRLISTKLILSSYHTYELRCVDPGVAAEINDVRPRVVRRRVHSATAGVSGLPLPL